MNGNFGAILQVIDVDRNDNSKYIIVLTEKTILVLVVDFLDGINFQFHCNTKIKGDCIA